IRDRAESLNHREDRMWLRQSVDAERDGGLDATEVQQSVARDVRDRLQIDACFRERSDDADVDARGLQELLADRPAQFLRPLRDRAPPAEEDPAREGESVAVNARRGESEDRIPRPNAPADVDPIERDQARAHADQIDPSPGSVSSDDLRNLRELAA